MSTSTEKRQLWKSHPLALGLSTGIWLCLVGVNLSAHLAERQVLALVNSRYEFKEDLHQSIFEFRNFVVSRYYNGIRESLEPKNELFSATRPYLRQSALETLTGKAALCGDFARAFVLLLQERGIQARRLYAFTDLASNHVLLEYFHPKEARWYVVDSAGGPKGLVEQVSATKLQADQVFQTGSPYYADYTRFNTRRFIGRYISKFEIPVFLTSLAERVAILKIIGATFAYLIFIGLLQLGDSVTFRDQHESRPKSGPNAS